LKARNKLKKIRSGTRLIKKDGIVRFSIVALEKVERRKQRATKHKLKIHFLAKYDDIQQADWSKKKDRKAPDSRPPYKINWVISPPDKGLGGGHQNIFRFVDYLERQGHDCRIYLYSAQYFQPAKEAQAVYRKTYPNSHVEFELLDGAMRKADAHFATGWETAYPVFNDPSTAKRFYFVQDYEPYFYPIGSEYVLAENTYRMGMYGITAGGWLSAKLNRDYGMEADCYPFGTDTNIYRYENTSKRKEVFFYARPVTSRRGFELGVMALQKFHEKMPDYTINLAGWDVSEYEIPFPYNNLKSLDISQLSDLYNKCAAALVISLTNMSLLPLELLSCGVVPVVNKGDNNQMVSDNPYIKYSDASPAALSDAMVEIVKKKDLPKYSNAAAQSVNALSWENAGAKFMQILKGQLDG
jgi:glycosyltransferase involved in cell wall biosynthesis